ncbi:DUF805 domain-containing protein [Rhizobium sp. R634]|uniref:DUF805 domain-containing protein n=1 Tax=Rhizobium sp. R634 TaxID=1764274 RepID=UPI0011320E4D|nr:DUF805 domain-containing protein [Rhizobium sp. R634]
MLESLFTFRGRLRRLQYLAVCVATTLVIGGIIGGGLWIMKSSLGGRQGMGAGAMFLILGIMLLPAFWISFSTQAARVRDIGWDPRILITASIAINAIAYLAPLLIPDGTTVDIISKLVKATNFGYGLTLLLLPSNYHVPDSPSFDPPRVSKPSGRVEIPAAPRPQGRGGATFGRRGL